MSANESGWTLQPHPHELQSAVTTDHVAVFGGDELQMEVSGESEHDDLNIDWTKIELDAEDVESILSGETYVERCEDLAVDADGEVVALYSEEHLGRVAAALPRDWDVTVRFGSNWPLHIHVVDGWEYWLAPGFVEESDADGQ